MKNAFFKYSLNALLVGVLAVMLLAAVACNNVDEHSSSATHTSALGKTPSTAEESTIATAPTVSTNVPVTTTSAPTVSTNAPTTTASVPVVTTQAPATTPQTPNTTTQAPATDASPIDQSKVEAAVVSAAERYGAVGVQVAVIEDGKVSNSFEYGWAEKDLRPMEADTKIRVASLTKTVIGMVTFRLVDESLLDLDADISDYIGVKVRNPAYPDDVITLRMLLSHTSGLDKASYTDSLEKLQKKLQTASTYTENRPGEVFEYNNFGFGVIGSICEIVTGKTMNTLAKEYFFTPMSIDAGFAPLEMDASEIAVIYNSDGEIGRTIEAMQSIGLPSEPVEHMQHYAGGLMISAADYAKLLTLLMSDGVYNGERYLSAESVAEIERVQLTKSNGTMQCLPVWKYDGLYGEDSLYYHTGNNYGVYALYTYDPESGFGTVVVTTGATLKYDSYRIYAICGNITEAIYENKRDVKDPEVSEPQAPAIVGISYLLSDQSVFSDSDRASALLGRLVRDQAVVVTAISDDWATVRYQKGVGYLPISALTSERPETADADSEACGGIVYLGDERIVAIDAGHQNKGMSEKEPNGPGSSEMKTMLSAGTSGVSSGLKEYELNLLVALKLRDELIARGYTVVMIRESHEVTLSNVQRAQIANASVAGAFVRIHANGSKDTSKIGAFTICQTPDNPYNGELYDESYRLTELLLDGFIATTEMKECKIWQTDTMTGINWAEVPSTIIEMGYMSNAEEDEKMATEEFQLNAAIGMANGIDAYFAE